MTSTATQIPTLDADPKYATAQQHAQQAQEAYDAAVAEYRSMLDRQHEDAARVVVDFFDFASGAVISEQEFLRQRDRIPGERCEPRRRIDIARMTVQASEAALSSATRQRAAEMTAARARAAMAIEQGSEFKRMVRALITDWAGRMDAALNLTADVEAARRFGYPVQPMPPVIQAEIDQLHAYAREAVRRGVVKASELPEAIRAMVEGR